RASGQSCGVTSPPASPARRTRRRAARVPWSIHKQPTALVAAVVGSSLASVERRGSRRLAWGNLSSLDGFGRRAGRAASTATTAAIPGVVLCVADGIVRIVVRAGDDSGGRPRREIALLIGVAAGEDKRCDHDRDAERHGGFPPHWSRP